MKFSRFDGGKDDTSGIIVANCVQFGWPYLQADRCQMAVRRFFCGAQWGCLRERWQIFETWATPKIRSTSINDGNLLPAEVSFHSHSKVALSPFDPWWLTRRSSVPRWPKILVTKYSHFSSRWNPSLNSYSKFSSLSDSPGTMTSLMTGLSKIKEDEATEFRMLRALGRKLDGKNKSWTKFGRNNPLDAQCLDVWRTTGAQAITWCTMTFQKFSSKRSSVFCKTSLLDTILNLRMCDLNTTIPPHTGFARVSLFSFQDVF